MKYIKLDDLLIDQIVLNELDQLGIINDKDEVSVNDEVEFFNNSNVVFGKANIKRVTLQKYEDHENSAENDLKKINVVGEKSNDDDLLKIVQFIFIPYDEPHKLANNTELNTKKIKIYADGGSRGNPGPSASGYVLMTEDSQIIKQNGVYIGITTNNQAEYKALLFALKDAIELKSESVSVYMDSLLVINQMKGIYKIKNLDLMLINKDITSLVKYFKKITFSHVPRELNKLADAEVNKCLDAETTV